MSLIFILIMVVFISYLIGNGNGFKEGSEYKQKIEGGVKE